MTDRGIIDMQHGCAMSGYFVSADKRVRDARENKSSHFAKGYHPRINTSQQKVSFKDHSKSLGMLKPIGSRTETTATNY